MTSRITVVIIVLSAVAIALASMRLGGYSGEAFQAIAHVFTGGIFGAALALNRTEFWIIGMSLSAVELFAFAGGTL